MKNPKLVIVESPAKARTINRFLGSDARVLASMGHVRDLPERNLGVEIGKRFQPRYVLTPNGKRVIKELKAAAEKAEIVYLATDPDREGEAIAWHLREILKTTGAAPFRRVTFHEITRRAIEGAFGHAGDIDTSKVDAQQARRVLDRLVGYQVSPLLWKRIKPGTSAGRVQSVALRLVCEREREIQDFKPREYWNFEAIFEPLPQGPAFKARLVELDGAKPAVPNAATAEAIAAELEPATFAVAATSKKQKTKRPPPPFITSTLQQAAGNLLRLSTRRTMRIAQQLYEGIELGTEGAVGLITYMRTDSVAVAREAQTMARTFIGKEFGPEFVPPKPNVFRSGKSAQEAHEAIRPTDVNRTPEKVAPYLDASQLRLYRLIWSRFTASQMAPARFLEHVIDVRAGGPGLSHDCLFRATAVSVVFPGYRKVFGAAEKGEAGDNGNKNGPSQTGNPLPDLAEGTDCRLVELNREQCFTEPPKRFTEALLVRELERNGVGRPSTYATIVNTIQERGYVEKKEKSRLAPTPLGFSVNDFLVSRLPDLFDVGFTARMESRLDEIEEGKLDWQEMLREFYDNFREWVTGLPPGERPDNERAAAFLAAFPEDLEWDPPVKRGKRVFDDRRFIDSLRSQVENGKSLSDKQWAAAVALAARYADRVPKLREAVEKLGMLDLFKKAEARSQAPAAEGQGGRNVPGPDAVPLLTALANVQWADPVKRGKRVYDDAAFFNSLRERVEQGRPLTPAQLEALKKLAVRYRNQVPDFDQLATQYGIEHREGPSDEQAANRARKLLGLLEHIKEWAPAVKRGRRQYDDRQFAESLQRQFQRTGSLSERQVQALEKLLARYASQVPGYAEKVQALGLPAPPPELPLPEGATCPECSAPLVVRKARGRSFYGCSTFPNCRFAASALPAKAE
ncbi:MAG: type I DNA topoisomerase [Kiritimatiellaeota bacterium]|nr:type I DNA topoisomerase [Kiritimatiellota bacterium]